MICVRVTRVVATYIRRAYAAGAIIANFPRYAEMITRVSLDWEPSGLGSGVLGGASMTGAGSRPSFSAIRVSRTSWRRGGLARAPLRQRGAGIVECRLRALVRRGGLHILPHHDHRQQHRSSTSPGGASKNAACPGPGGAACSGVIVSSRRSRAFSARSRASSATTTAGISATMTHYPATSTGRHSRQERTSARTRVA
jgi:hypothetical protein